MILLRNHQWFPTTSGSLSPGFHPSPRPLCFCPCLAQLYQTLFFTVIPLPKWPIDLACHIPYFASLCKCNTLSPKGFPDIIPQIQYYSSFRSATAPKPYIEKLHFPKIFPISTSLCRTVSLSRAGVYLLSAWNGAVLGAMSRTFSCLCMYSNTTAVLFVFNAYRVSLPACLPLGTQTGSTSWTPSKCEETCFWMTGPQYRPGACLTRVEQRCHSASEIQKPRVILPTISLAKLNSRCTDSTLKMLSFFRILCWLCPLPCFVVILFFWGGGSR